MIYKFYMNKKLCHFDLYLFHIKILMIVNNIKNSFFSHFEKNLNFGKCFFLKKCASINFKL